MQEQTTVTVQLDSKKRFGVGDVLLPRRIPLNGKRLWTAVHAYDSVDDDPDYSEYAHGVLLDCAKIDADPVIAVRVDLFIIGVEDVAGEPMQQKLTVRRASTVEALHSRFHQPERWRSTFTRSVLTFTSSGKGPQ